MKKSGGNILSILLMLIALTVFGYSGYRLYLILNDYHKTDVEYEKLNDDYTRKTGSPADVLEDPDTWPKYEDAEPPLDIDWAALQAVNSDVVGWVYVEAQEKISYPIVWRRGDDDYYLHRSFEGADLYAGAIFLEGENNPDFADPVSIIYGHNMKSGSMFAFLDKLKEPEVYQKNPYFWILTPNGDYRYHIYSAFQTTPDSSTYQLFAKRGTKFLEWEKEMQSLSAVQNSVPLFEDDSAVVLSTCETDHVHRNVVIGRCVSSSQPRRTNEEYRSVGTVGNTLTDLEREEASGSETQDLYTGDMTAGGNGEVNGNIQQTIGDVDLGI